MKLYVLLVLCATTTYVSAICKTCIGGYGNYTQLYDYVTFKDSCAKPFYWFFESLKAKQIDGKKIPLVIVPGCPGQAGTANLVLQSGPFGIGGTKRPTSLISEYHALYIDSSGVGFGVSECNQGYNSNYREVANQSLGVILDFFKYHPEFKPCPLYLLADGPCTKSAVYLATLLNEEYENKNCNQKFEGIFLTSIWADPVNQIKTWPSYLLSQGFIDTKRSKDFEQTSEDIFNMYSTDEMSENRLEDAISIYDEYEKEFQENYNIDLCNSNNEPNEYSETNRYDKHYVSKILRCKEDNSELLDFMDHEVKPTLSQKVSYNTYYNKDEDTAIAVMKNDFFTSGTADYQSLFDNTDMAIAFIVGQYDVISNNMGIEAFINSIYWKSGNYWYKAPYKQFSANKKYSKCNIPIPERHVLQGDRYPIQFYAKTCKNGCGYTRKFSNIYDFVLLKTGRQPFAENPACLMTILSKVIKPKES